ncbi:serine 3-dehydrogenase [Salmonella enterica]|nr:serine 3-dehydrogenase [Salmonella enterica]EBN2521032.1 serine 3-dehydrogenase [Salmonella enterica]
MSYTNYYYNKYYNHYNSNYDYYSKYYNNYYKYYNYYNNGYNYYSKNGYNYYNKDGYNYYNKNGYNYYDNNGHNYYNNNGHNNYDNAINGWDEVKKLTDYHHRGDGQYFNYKPSYDHTTASKAISRSNVKIDGFHVNGKDAEVITYSFPKWDYYQRNLGQYSHERDTGLTGFTDQQKYHAKLCLQAWGDVANIEFVEVSADKPTHITMGNFYGSGQAYALKPKSYNGADYRGFNSDGQAWFNANQAENLYPELGNYGRHTFIHELGHTLGLDHPSSYSANIGTPTYSSSASYAEDNRQYSVMSYWSETNTGADFQGTYAAAPLMDDVIAIQRLYGPNMATRTDNTVYGFNSNTDRDFYTATHSSQKLIFSIWDAGGSDTLNFSGFNQNQRINLNEGSFSDVGGLKGNVSIVPGVTIENAIGGSGNDVIVGNAVDNLLHGQSGDDVIYGGDGKDQSWGGKGKDIFVFASQTESPASNPDIIWDFESGKDKIDLSFLNQSLKKMGSMIHFVDSFSGKAGEAMLTYNSHNNVSELSLNTEGGYNSDFLVQIIGSVDTNTDFIV